MKPEQATFASKPTTLASIAPTEPVDDHGTRKVLVSSSTNARTSFHKQNPHKPGRPLCGQLLRADHTEWRLKPKTAMERSCDPCPECYPEVSRE